MGPPTTTACTDDHTRRRFVTATALAGIGALAGCSDGSDGGGAVGTEDETEASFNPHGRAE